MAETEVRKAATAPGERVTRLIVLVDGESSQLHYMSVLLQRLEYNIHTTKNAEDALDIIDVAHPSLVLTEITLSGMDGLELLKKIKRNPGTYAIPVFILTALKDSAIKDACLREGCNAFFQKPIDPDVLYAAIQKATETTPRQYIRLNTCLNVIVGAEKDSSTVIGDFVSALSENGMYISSAKPKPVGLQVPITIFLEDKKIDVEGMVLYSFERGKGPLRTPGMGIKFVRIKPEDQRQIKLFIGREITKGLTMAPVGGTAS
jgi:CheY-like chemotaxis protein